VPIEYARKKEELDELEKQAEPGEMVISCEIRGYDYLWIRN
jgi:hypothetical protein